MNETVSTNIYRCIMYAMTYPTPNMASACSPMCCRLMVAEEGQRRGGVWLEVIYVCTFITLKVC